MSTTGLKISELTPIPKWWTEEQIKNLLEGGIFPLSDGEYTKTYKVALSILLNYVVTISDIVNPHSSEKVYEKNDWCINDGKLYKCVVQSTYGDFSPSAWEEKPLSELIETLLSSNKIRYLTSPTQTFDFDSLYDNGILPIIYDKFYSNCILKCTSINNYEKDSQVGKVYTFTNIRNSNHIVMRYYSLGALESSRWYETYQEQTMWDGNIIDLANISLISLNHNNTKTYVKGNYCLDNDKLYKCDVESTRGNFNPNEWVETNIGEELFSLEKEIESVVESTVHEAPVDDIPYVRKNNEWVTFTDALEDNLTTVEL